MALQFPKVDHKPLGNPPIKEVICQVQFPAILRISNEEPVVFQDIIRERFPKMKTDQVIRIESTDSKINELDLKNTVYRFLNRDEKKTVSLSSDFYALSISQYESWQAFREDLYFVTQAIIDIYKVPYMTRLGLRYINILTPENTGANTFYPEVLDIPRNELTSLLQTKEFSNTDLALTHIVTSHELGV